MVHLTDAISTPSSLLQQNPEWFMRLVPKKGRKTVVVVVSGYY